LIFRTNKRVYAEAASWPPEASERISRLWKEQWANVRTARQERLELREELMVARLDELRSSDPASKIGAIVGAFHTWPYLELKRRYEKTNTAPLMDYQFQPPDSGVMVPNTHSKDASPVAP